MSLSSASAARLIARRATAAHPSSPPPLPRPTICPSCAHTLSSRPFSSLSDVPSFSPLPPYISYSSRLRPAYTNPARPRSNAHVRFFSPTTPAWRPPVAVTEATSGRTAAEKGEAAVVEPVKETGSTTMAKGRRPLKAKKAAIHLTPAAVSRLRNLLTSDPNNPKLIRIGVRNKGCAGMSYHLDYVSPSEKGKFDEMVEQDGVQVLVDSKALFSIIGSEMDWVEDRLSAKFAFRNPNITEQCGCGESFLV